MGKDIELTLEGLEQLKAEYRHLIDVERPQVQEQLQLARSMGDLSENADYDAARNKQAEVESRIKELDSIIAHATVLNVKKGGKVVSVGTTVKFVDVNTNVEKTVKIVSTIEADPINSNKISNECPLGVALIGKKVGDEATIKAVKPSTIKILEIKFDK